jgi:hypothetical protein
MVIAMSKSSEVARLGLRITRIVTVCHLSNMPKLVYLDRPNEHRLLTLALAPWTIKGSGFYLSGHIEISSFS